MVIYLQHPVHGRKVATLELEAAYDESNGWERYDLETPLEPVNMLASVTPMAGRRRRVTE